jgi:hypothetical protein
MQQETFFGSHVQNAHAVTNVVGLDHRLGLVRPRPGSSMGAVVSSAKIFVSRLG